MKRRKFINNITNIGSAALVAMYPVSLYQHEQNKIVPADDSMNIPGSSGSNEMVSARVEQYNGKPTMFVNDTPCFPMAYISYYPKQFRYKNMRQSGIKFFSLSITLGDGFYGAYRNGKVRLDKKGIWDAPGQIDFSVLDESIKEILDVAPDAYIFPRIYCDSPGWWNNLHPAETNRTYDQGLPMRQSFSSLVWREETAEVIKRIVTYIRQSSYSDRIAGIHIGVGETEESVHHKWLGYGDYSIAAHKKFRQWLLKKYDENQIKSLFNKSIEQINIPSPEERDKAEFGDFYDPAKSRLAMDYNIFRCEEIVECCDLFCRVVKETSNNSLFTGVFYGYTLVDWRDHYALASMLKSPYIDFFSCTNGGGRNTKIGVHDLHFLTETDSVHKANKLFYYEADTRTCMSKWISELQPDVDPYHEYDTSGWLGPETIEKSLELLKAVFSRVICTGSTHWWFDLWGGWYDHEKISALFREMQKTGNESIHLPRSPVSEICVIVDERSLLCYATASQKSTWVGQQISQIGRVGAPYDIYLHEDLSDLDVSKYKMFVFLNSLFLTEEDRNMIRNKCMKDNRLLLWFYAPGMIDSNTISVSNVSSLVNMRLSSKESLSESEVYVNLPDKEMIYNGVKVSPFLYVTEGADTVYGQTKEGYPVLAEKSEHGYSNVIACLPSLPWNVIQHFAIKAGAHIYSKEGDVVYANQSYLSVSASKPGRREIRMPGKYALKELLGAGAEFKPDNKFEIDFTAESCRFFQVSAG